MSQILKHSTTPPGRRIIVYLHSISDATYGLLFNISSQMAIDPATGERYTLDTVLNGLIEEGFLAVAGDADFENARFFIRPEIKNGGVKLFAFIKDGAKTLRECSEHLKDAEADTSVLTVLEYLWAVNLIGFRKPSDFPDHPDSGKYYAL